MQVKIIKAIVKIKKRLDLVEKGAPQIPNCSLYEGSNTKVNRLKLNR